MGSSIFAGSQSLLELAERLRQYKVLDQIDSSTIKNNNLSEEPTSQASETNSISPKLEGFKFNRAAVLVCLFEGKEGDLRVILTKRSSTLSSHSGEVSLPGGKMEEGDGDVIDTALREAKEEIGLDPKIVNVFTVLEPFMAKRGIVVTPVIGILGNKEAFKPALNAAEVEAIFDAPLEMFLKDENRREKEQEWMGQSYVLHFFDYEVENKQFVIWALTAGILIRVASIVYQRTPSFQERRPPFWHRSRQ